VLEESIYIDEFEFHVCLSTENSLDSDHIPLLSNDHGWTIFHSVVTVSNLPMNVLETSIGFVDRSSIGDTSLSTVNNVKVEVNRADLIRVGYPAYGNIRSGFLLIFLKCSMMNVSLYRHQTMCYLFYLFLVHH